MTEKISSLTQEQIDQFPVFVDKWLKIGLSTEPVDFEKAKEAACLAYELAGLKKPTQFHVTQSPVDAIKFIQKLDPSKSKNDILQEMSYGAHEAAWLSFYNYFQEAVGLDCCNKLQGLMDLAKYTGWVSFYEDVVVFQHRPSKIKMDDQNRLHCEDGPAILYPDGYSIYAWHGQTIPADWIEKKDQMDPATAINWPNVEQRRAAAEIIGWAKVLDQLKSKVIDKDGDPEIGELHEVNIPDIGRERFLKVQCGTGRTFALPVPPTMKTALEAQAWTWGMDVKEFKRPEVRT